MYDLLKMFSQSHDLDVTREIKSFQDVDLILIDDVAMTHQVDITTAQMTGLWNFMNVSELKMIFTANVVPSVWPYDDRINDRMMHQSLIISTMGWKNLRKNEGS